ncbi:MAG: biotin/lipoyl-binding protein [Alphaproteobacteria bacterium]
MRLFRAEPDKNGAPRWRLYDAISNIYYDIGWAEFEALSRFSTCETAQILKDKIEAETTLKLDDNDIPLLIKFLNEKGLLASSESLPPEFKAKKTMPLWKKIVHNYLFFSIPLFKPQKFLNASWPYVRPFFSQAFFRFSMLVLLFFSFLTLGRIDEFIHTFFQFFSLEGVITITVVFFFIKILHELGHAYTAHKYGVDVPHMGMAFIVMYPILYTETTSAWRLDNRYDRMAIGLAGIRTELILAAYALAAWHFLPPGIAQSLAFSIVAISLTGSLLINLNPLMRFDGYFIFSDYLGIENLHARGFAAARWFIRKTLFGLHDDPPEESKARLRFLINFGFATLIYRFFLFLGIALLVYYIFFKPLGLFLMIIELLWFIGLPIWSEIKIWIEKRAEIWKQTRSKITLALLAVLCLITILPSSHTIALPAMAHAPEYQSLHPPAAAKIEKIYVRDNQAVEKGDLLIELSSPALEKDFALASLEYESLLREKRQLQSGGDLSKERLAVIDIELESALQKRAALQEELNKLIMRAEFAGIIRDLNTEIAIGQFAGPETMMMRVLKPASPIISAYARPTDLARLHKGNRALFRPSDSLLTESQYVLSAIDTINTADLDWPELSSIFGGPLAAEYSPDAQNRIVPRQSLYKVTFKAALNPDENTIELPKIAQSGMIYVSGEPEIPLLSFLRKTGQIFIAEINLN